MKIAVLGTGMVGNALASKLVDRGHEVCMGSRTPDNEAASAWASQTGARASHATFADASAGAEIVFNATKGEHTLAALKMAGADNLAGKVLVDVSNPLDFSQGMPPTLFVTGRDSLGEQIQRAFPDTRVVKSLNTMNCELMLDPGRLGAHHTVFVNGDDAEAKKTVSRLLIEDFGWSDVIDLGDITASRGVESWLPLWVRIWGAVDTPHFNLKIVRG